MQIIDEILHRTETFLIRKKKHFLRICLHLGRDTMYRVFCESYENYIKQYKELTEKVEYRYIIVKPFELIRCVEEKQYSVGRSGAISRDTAI